MSVDMKDLVYCILTAVTLIILFFALVILPTIYSSLKDKAYTVAADVSLNLEMKKDSLKTIRLIESIKQTNAQEAQSD